MTTREVLEAFVELVQHDDDLMRAEFEALVDAGWHQPPPPPPARPQPVPRPPLWPVGSASGDLSGPLDPMTRGARWCRQRGPPTRWAASPPTRWAASPPTGIRPAVVSARRPGPPGAGRADTTTAPVRPRRDAAVDSLEACAS
ncbi:hypothetical protein [Plantactinospora sonchi]|uniref:SnoaL-like domain-containing protein n=1 Tax=Plantactinospora sonchi TaxID=1544735 RepID=A0ABU7RT42_9ACTN